MKLLRCGVFLVACVSCMSALAQSTEPSFEITYGARPVVAIWQMINGVDPEPYLRIAIWDNGAVVFAKDPANWKSPLQRGSIAASQVEQLKLALVNSGVFELTRNSYLVPDAPVDIIQIEVGKKSQRLYWDERETANYGININPTPQAREFKRCWRLVNRLALLARPEQHEPEKVRFVEPATWQWPKTSP